MESNQILDNQEFKGNIILPNSTAVLVLGILSIVTCFCYGIIGLVLGIIGLVLSNKDMALYKANSSMYTVGSYKNLNAGRICSIIGLCLSAVYLLIILLYFVFVGTLITSGLGSAGLN